MSYIIFDEPTGRIISVSYSAPSKETHYITVNDKVGDDFLSGMVPTTEYKVLKKKLSNLYQLVYKDAKPSIGLFDPIFQPFKKHIPATFYYKHIAPIKRDMNMWYANNIAAPLHKAQIEAHDRKKAKENKPNIVIDYSIKGIKKTYYFLKEVFSPYGTFPGEYYAYKILGYAPTSKVLFRAGNPQELKNLCIAPWVHLHTWPNNKVYPCCLTPMEDTIGDLTDNTLDEVWNDTPIRDMRLQFMNDERPQSCHRCFSIEDAGGSSYRHHLNKQYKNDFDLVRSTKEDGYVHNLNIKYWDFRFSNICNFKCRTCGPQLSSGWYEDTEQLYGSLPKDLPDPQHVVTKPTWQELQPLFHIVEEIYFAGGEPLIMEDHYRILSKLVDMGKFNVSLSYNTNFSRLKYKKLNVLDIWPKFETVKIGASIDAMGQRAEFMRSGTTWNKIVENRNQMKIKSPNTDFFTNITLGSMNCFHILDFYKWSIENDFIPHPKDIHINLVQFPKHYSLQALPIEYKKQLTDLYHNMADYCNSNKIDHVGNQWKMAANYMNEDDIFEREKNTFRNITKSLDKIRNEKFIDVFPELELMFK
jgi:MoaA/NifB/PqqE/SkfB family radical SAM enzyme